VRGGVGQNRRLDMTSDDRSKAHPETRLSHTNTSSGRSREGGVCDGFWVGIRKRSLTLTCISPSRVSTTAPIAIVVAAAGTVVVRLTVSA